MIVHINKDLPSESPQIFEFQGSFENIDLFNGIFDPNTLRMTFDCFYLEGRRIEKKLTIFSNETETSNLKHLGYANEVILFDKPPRYIITKS